MISFYVCWGFVLLSECELGTLLHIVIKSEFVGVCFMVDHAPILFGSAL